MPQSRQWWRRIHIVNGVSQRWQDRTALSGIQKRLSEEDLDRDPEGLGVAMREEKPTRSKGGSSGVTTLGWRSLTRVYPKK